MSTPVLTFFNIKGGVGKTSLVYHLAWMFSQVGKRVVVVDLDPQANLTSALLDESQLEKLWDLEKPQGDATIFQCVRPLTEAGDILPRKQLGPCGILRAGGGGQSGAQLGRGKEAVGGEVQVAVLARLRQGGGLLGILARVDDCIREGRLERVGLSQGARKPLQAPATHAEQFRRARVR